MQKLVKELIIKIGRFLLLKNHSKNVVLILLGGLLFSPTKQLERYPMKRSVKFEDLNNQWMEDPKFRKAYQDLELEYEIALKLIQARLIAGLTQEELASRMNNSIGHCSS